MIHCKETCLLAVLCILSAFNHLSLTGNEGNRAWCRWCRQNNFTVKAWFISNPEVLFPLTRPCSCYWLHFTFILLFFPVVTNINRSYQWRFFTSLICPQIIYSIFFLGPWLGNVREDNCELSRGHFSASCLINHMTNRESVCAPLWDPRPTGWEPLL